MLLTFDTCLDKTYIGLADKKTNFKDTIIVENEGNKYHSAFLISNIRDILKKHNLTPNDITTIATDIGPKLKPTIIKIPHKSRALFKIFPMDWYFKSSIAWKIALNKKVIEMNTVSMLNIKVTTIVNME